MKKMVSVAGTMGIGKSTLVALIAKECNFHPLFETVNANPFLPHFYKDMKKWVFHSQMFFLTAKAKQLKRIKINKNIVQDTPILQDVYSYAKAQYMLGNMTKHEWNAYLEVYKLIEKAIIKPHCVIYLNAPISIIYERIIKRNRNYESGTKKEKLLSYLKTLDSLNRSLIVKLSGQTQVITIDTGKDHYFTNAAKKKELYQRIV